VDTCRHCTGDECIENDYQCEYEKLCNCTDDGTVPGDPCTMCWCDEVLGCITEPMNCSDGNVTTIDTCIVIDGKANCTWIPFTCNISDPCATIVIDYETHTCITIPKNCSLGPCFTGQCDPLTGTCSLINCGPSKYDACGTIWCDPDIGMCLDEETTCPPLDDCTIPTCDKITGECIYPPTQNAMQCANVSRPCKPCQCDINDGECFCEDIVCTSTDPCMIGMCIEPSGTCVYHPKCPLGPLDMCNEGLCVLGKCITTPLINCSDSDSCTVDGCDPDMGCYHEPIVCQPGTNPCITVWCEDGVCVPHMKKCDDNDTTTKDWCDGETGNCTHVKACPCDDNDICTDDFFDEITWTCVHIPHQCPPAHSDDGTINHCLIPQCDTVFGCTFDMVHCNTPRCEGHSSCHTAHCVPSTGECVIDEISCDDGDNCTIDTCIDGKCHHHDVQCGVDVDDDNKCSTHWCSGDGECHHGEKDCGDDNPCTLDTCDGKTGYCHHREKDCYHPEWPCLECSCDQSNGECSCVLNHCDDGTFFFIFLFLMGFFKKREPMHRGQVPRTFGMRAHPLHMPTKGVLYRNMQWKRWKLQIRASCVSTRT
jgi:hypothetical protein